MVDVDASSVGLGAVISQDQDGHLRVIAYASRTFNRPEANYCITRREMLGAVYGLKQFKQYLLGRHFVLRSDHAALTFLRSSAEPVGQQARWMNFFEMFDFDLVHRAGTSHQNADGLSRRPCEVGSDVDCRQCHKPDGTLRVHAVTTRRQAQSTADNEVAAETDPVAATPPAESDEGETDVPEFHRRPPRRRNRRRGDHRIPPHASTDIADIAPDGWSSEMLAAEQLADVDLS